VTFGELSEPRRRDADLDLGDRWRREPIAALMRGERDIEKSERHSRGGRLSFSLTELVHERERARSLCRDDGLLESVENGDKGREDDRLDRLREGDDIIAANLLGKLSLRSSQFPGAGWTCTQSSLPCTTVPVGIGTCVTVGDAPVQPAGGIGCVIGNMGVSTPALGAAQGVPNPPHSDRAGAGNWPTPNIGVPCAGQPALLFGYCAA